MDIQKLFSQSELAVIMSAVQVYKEQQENEEHHRKQEGWDTANQHEIVQTLDGIEEKLYNYID